MNDLDRALTVPCPACKMAADSGCVDLDTGAPAEGVHGNRIHRAYVVSEAIAENRATELAVEVDRLTAALNRVRDLCHAADTEDGIPPDGTLLVATSAGGHQNLPETERVYLRADQKDTPAEPALTTPLFYPIGGPTDGNAQPVSYGEVLWLDDPACDRGTVQVEAFLPVELVLEAVLGLDGAV